MKKSLLACFILFLAVSSVLAQERVVTGKVKSIEDGTVLPGVNVVLKGTTNGTVTDADGNYKLTVPSNGGTIVFSFIGLETTEVNVGEKSLIDIALKTDAKQLNEVIVVGYGTQDKRDLNGSVASVSGRDIANFPNQSFDQGLQGRAAGVSVTTPNGVLNNPPVIRIRGMSSISLSSFPLVVIDGIPTFTGDNSGSNAANNPLSSINPADIESVEVLKDASASAIYGSRAAAGVILVTTKRGKKGSSKINLDSWVGMTEPVRLLKVLNAQQYVMIKNEGRVNAGLLPGYATANDANGNMIDTDWYKEAYRRGLSFSNTLNFSGANDQTSYYVSVGRQQQQGMIKNNDFNRTSVRVSLDHKIAERLKIGTTFAFTNGYNSAPSTGSIPGSAFATAGLARLAFVTSPTVAPFLNNGAYNINGANIGSMNNIDPVSGAPLQVGFGNPRALLDLNSAISSSNQIQGSVYASYEIIKGLSVRTTFGVDRLTIEDKTFLTGLTGDGFTAGGGATNLYRTRNRWNWQNTAQYDKKIGENHNLSVLIGGEQQYSTDERWGANRTTLADPFFTSYQGNFTNIAVPAGANFQTENYLVSYFSRVNYDFGKKYFASVNVRRDGYSAWANKYGNFYGASLGYSISEEQFFKDSPLASTISFLKLKGSYGEVGNSQGINDFASLQTYASGLYGANATLGYNQAGNSALTWEKSKKTDVGLLFGLLQDRIQGEITYYKNLVDGLILDVPQSPSKGVPNPTTANTIPANIGSMQNQGFEISIKANVINKTDFSWAINANVTTLENKVLALVNQNQQIITATSGLETPNVTVVGQSIGSFLAVPTLGVNPANGFRLFEKQDGTVVQYNHSAPAVSRWTTLDGTPTTAVTQLADGRIIGPSLPKWYGGFDNTFKYKSFDLGVFIQFSGGNYIYNGTKAGLRDQRFWNNSVAVLDRWTPENPNGTIPRVVAGDNVSNGSTIVISENVEKGDFLRFRNIQLGYTFPKTLLERVNITSARIYASVQNAFLITKYSGFDPEIETNGNSTTGGGVDRNSVGQARTVTVGVNISF